MQCNLVIVPEDELISRIMVDELVRADYSLVVKPGSSYSEEDFIHDHAISAWLACNMLLHMCKEQCGYAASAAVQNLLTAKGLRNTIGWLASYADSIVNGKVTVNHHVDCAFTDPFEVAFWFAVQGQQTVVVRQICLFLKRFAYHVPNKYSIMHDQAIEAFQDNQKRLATKVLPRLKTLARHTYDGTLEGSVVTLARELVRKLIGETAPVKRHSLPLIGPGAARNCGRTRLEKLVYLLENREYIPTVAPNLFQYREEHADSVPRTRKKRNKTIELKPLHREKFGSMRFAQVCRLTTVPKTSSKVRLIAMEDPCCMARQLLVKEALDDRLKASKWGRMLPLHDQSVNQRFARIAALNGEFATIDMTSASDNVTKELVQMLFPDDWNSMFRSCTPVAYITDEWEKAAHPLYSFATMGCGCTFIVEAIVFWSISQACCLLALARNDRQRFPFNGKWEPWMDDWVDKFSVTAYGDDVILPIYAVGLLLEVAPLFGFIVNEDKSFWTGQFRESCGADWINFDGVVSNVTPVYWPRHGLPATEAEWFERTKRSFANGDVTFSSVIESLIALQHRCYDRYPAAARFLASFLQGNIPWLTCSCQLTDDVEDILGPREKGLNAYYVGGKVDIRYRTVGQIALEDTISLTLPDGYVPANKIFAWFKETALSPLDRATILKFGERSLHISWRKKDTIPSTLSVQGGISTLRLVAYDDFLTKKPSPLLNVHVCDTVTGNFQEFCPVELTSVGDYSSLAASLVGEGKVTVTFK